MIHDLTVKVTAGPSKETADRFRRRINARLDALDPEKFRGMCRCGNRKKVKINAIVVRDFNDAKDAVELARMPLRAHATTGELETLIRDALRSKPSEHDLAHDLVPLNRLISEIDG